MPRFSILIPVYNVEAYLDDCLLSVQRQTFTDCEVIAVDDGSTDNCAAILEHHREAFAQRGMAYTVVHQANQGLGAARNTALDHATGQYLLFLDSDDMLEPYALTRLDDNLHGQDLLCFNGRHLVEGDGRLKLPQPLNADGPMDGWQYYNRYALVPRRFAFVCVVLRCYRRQYLLDAGLRFRPGIYHEDNLFTPQACRHAHTVSVIPDVLYTYRLRAGSISSGRSLKHRQDTLIVANSLADLFRHDDSIDRTVLYRSITHHYQAAFADSNSSLDRQLLPLVDWDAYRRVSRTKLRHRLLYRALRLSPRLFRFALHHS